MRSANIRRIRTNDNIAPKRNRRIELRDEIAKSQLNQVRTMLT